jgi:hypothetical protein
MSSFFFRLWCKEEGQDIAEYAVMPAVILVLVVGTIHGSGCRHYTNDRIKRE